MVSLCKIRSGCVNLKGVNQEFLLDGGGVEVVVRWWWVDKGG